MTTRARTMFEATATALVYPAVALGVSVALARDTSLVGRMMPSALITSIAWWVASILASATAVVKSRKLWLGAVAGAGTVALFVVMLAVWQPAAFASRAEATGSYMRASVATVALPWALGMVFGWTALRHHRFKYDGVESDGVH